MHKHTILSRLLVLVLVLSVLLTPVMASAEDSTKPDLTTGSPWLASSVQGVVTEDTPASQKDDFYLFANKDRILSYTIPEGYSSAGTLTKRDVENDEDILALFTDSQTATSPDSKLALELYGLLMDWDTRNALGVEPLAEELDAIEEIDSIRELSRYLVANAGDNPLIRVEPDTNRENSSEKVLSLLTSSLTLSDSAEYGELTPYGELQKETRSGLVLYLLNRVGYTEDDAAEILDNCFRFEAKLSKGICTSEQQNLPEYLVITNNPVSPEQLKEAEGNVPVLECMDALGYARKPVINVYEPVWLRTLNKLYSSDYLGMIKDYLIVRKAISIAKFLDRDCFTHVLDASNRLSGASGYLKDEQYAAYLVSNLLSWSVSKMYCEKYFTEQDKQIVQELIDKVLDAYAEILDEADFISAPTREKAKGKLNNMTVRALYPDDWTPYSNEGLVLAVEGEDNSLVSVIHRIDRFLRAKNAAEFTDPVDKTRWFDGYYPTTVNAFYSMSDNSINILAAFCHGEIFNSDMTVEEQYGSLGTVIGHEISHSFDAAGSQFDKDGNMVNWWTDEDKEAFTKKIQRIAAYTDKVSYWEGTNLNGSIMTGEVCADMGGMRVMLKLAKEIENFNYDQFFRTFAFLWSEVRTYENTLSGMKDVHPPAFFRGNATVQQFDEFLTCYDIRPGDKMYLAPEDRIAIW